MVFLREGIGFRRMRCDELMLLVEDITRKSNDENRTNCHKTGEKSHEKSGSAFLFV